MKETWDGLVNGWFIGVLTVMLVISIVHSCSGGSPVELLEKEAIEKGYAQYSPVTGDFEWKKP